MDLELDRYTELNGWIAFLETSPDPRRSLLRNRKLLLESKPIPANATKILAAIDEALVHWPAKKRRRFTPETLANVCHDGVRLCTEGPDTFWLNPSGSPVPAMVARAAVTPFFPTAFPRPMRQPREQVVTEVPLPVVDRVRVARRFLVDAQCRLLDDHGYSCRLLDRLQDGAAALLAEWAGRQRPSIPPRHVVASAVEWRRTAGRGY